MSFKIILPDNSFKEFDHQPTALEVAGSIGPRLAKDTVGVKINGESEVCDIRALLPNNAKIELVTLKSPDANEVIRHSCAHLMAQAVQMIWPEIKVTIGPVIENGFYYDFDSKKTFSDDDLAQIEKKMTELANRDLPLVKEVWPIDKAIETFTKMKETFKVEIIQDLKAKGAHEVSIYHQGEWFDLCRGPHVQRTGQLKAFKLLSVAGAYWRGDEKREMLQRIYATAFVEKKDLEQYLFQIEEAKKRDHRKIGKDMGLFYFHPWAPGSPFFTGRGTIIYNELQKYMRELYVQYGYNEVITPQLFDVDLFHKSGHYDNYKENMYFSEIDEREFSMKPMNCPSHCLLFASEKYSYRDLPYKMADFGRLHRYERSGALSGLTRVRTFCQDDAHIFCTMNQLQGEIVSFMKLLNQVYTQLGMSEYVIYLSTRPEKRIGTEEFWDMAEGSLKNALESMSLPYKINEGDGAFYGPKLDIMFVDAIKRPWQLGTIQCDPNLPNNFDLKYTGEDNQEHRPIMLHRAILGSLERFIGVYLEHCAGSLPLWLCPEQVRILNITDRANHFCEEVQKNLQENGVRCHFDSRNEKLSYKIREAQLERVPYMIVVGDKEAETKTLSIRLKSGQTINGESVDNFIKIVRDEIKQRSVNALFKV